MRNTIIRDSAELRQSDECLDVRNSTSTKPQAEAGNTIRQTDVLLTVKIALFPLLCTGIVVAGADRPNLWRDPGPVASLNLAVGPGGIGNSPKPPFRFVTEETRGVTPKVVVTDARSLKWMVKFGEEAKAEIFASRIAWAAGFPVRASYYVASGTIRDVPSLKRAGAFIDNAGSFHEARFQKFDDGNFHEVPGGKLDLQDKTLDLRQLNSLKLTLLLVSNWDVKPANTAVFETGGHRYAAVSDWGASLGDPGSPNPNARKWNCQAFTQRTSGFIEGIDNGYVVFNYEQYAGKNIDAVSRGIRIDDAKWFLSRMDKLSDGQLRAGLRASGADATEAACFANAIRTRLNLLANATEAERPGVRSSKR